MGSAAGRPVHERNGSPPVELGVATARSDGPVGGLAPRGRAERVDVRADDVGEAALVDVVARGANARQLEGRLVALQGRRTGALVAASPAGRLLARAARAGGRNFVALLAGVIASSGVCAALGLAAYGAWRWRRRRRPVARAAAP